MPTAAHVPWLDDRLHLRVFVAADISLASGAWFTPNVRSSFWRFYWNHDAGGCLDYDGETLEMAPRTPYFVPSHVLFTCRNTRALQHFYVHFDVLGLPAPLHQEAFGAPVTLCPTDRIEQSVHYLAGRLSTETPGFTDQCEIKALLYSALADAFAAISPPVYEKYLRFAAAGEILQAALRAIDADPGADLPNSHLAALCHLSTDHFIRRFHGAMGQTPAAYIQSRRATAAAQMLLFNDWSIEHIAAAAGFGNRFYFSRVFARHFGISPAAYRSLAKRGPGQ